MEDVLRRFDQLQETGEPLYYDLAMRGASHRMRGAGTIEGPFVLGRLFGVKGEPKPLVFVGTGSYQSGIRLIPIETVESFELGLAPESTRG